MSVEQAFARVPAFKETRLASLYSDFSHLKDFNPEGFDANCKAWKDLIIYCIREHVFASNVSIPGSLASAFSSAKYGEPKAIYNVVDQMVREGTLMPWSVFSSNSYSASASFTDYLFPSTLISRSWTSLKLSVFSSKKATADEYYLDMVSLREKAEEAYLKLQKQVSSAGVYSAKLYNEDSLITTLQAQDKHMSTIDAKAILLYLTRDKHRLQILQRDSLETYYKMDKSAITENDVGIVNLKASIEKVTSQMSSLETKVDTEIPSRIKMLLASGKSEVTRTRIKQLLYQKARASKSLEQSSNLLEKLTGILEEIDKAETNASVVSTLQSAKKALSAFNEQVSIGDVEDLMLDIDEQVSKTDEISNSLSISQSGDFDDEELDRELEELEVSESKKQVSETEQDAKQQVQEKEQDDEDVIERLQKVSLNDTTSLVSEEVENKKRNEQVYAT